jgi:putative DNA primase/helicase
MDHLANPLKTFVEEECILGADHNVPRHLFYKRWVGWCEEHGEHPGSANSFGIKLRAAFPAVGDARPRTDNPGRERVYTGIKLVNTPANVNEVDYLGGMDLGPHHPNLKVV